MRREREYHVGQHVNSQVLDVTKASHCTGSVSSALESGDAGRGGPDHRSGQTSQARSPQQHQPVSPWSQQVKVEKSGPTAGERTRAQEQKSILNRRDEHVQKKTQERCQLQAQGQDENKTKFKMNVGMKITSCADNTSNKNLTTMTVKDIRGHLDKILATGFDVMCGCSVQEGKLVFRKKQMKNFEDNAKVILNVTGELKKTVSTRPMSQEHLGSVRQSCCVHNRTASGDVRLRSVSRRNCRAQEIHTMMIFTQRSEHLKTVRSQEVAGHYHVACVVTCRSTSRR